MKPASFAYHTPRTVDEAVALLARVAPSGGRVLAGGQTLVPAMSFRLAQPSDLVDINGVRELERLGVDGDALVIGALVRHAAFHKPAVAGPLGPLLTEVVRHIAHLPIRTRGTFCGSLAYADPASEWCLTAATLGARLVAASTRGRRTIAAADYFQGALSTALDADELLVEARLPLLSEGTRFGFSEFSRRRGDFALGMALVVYRVEGGVIREARVGLGGIEDRPRRLAAAEAALEGKAPDETAFRAAAAAAVETVDPLEDAQTTAAYRRKLAGTVIRRALERAAS
jgi:carbon-monoxide dehydrogenase medium subunit